MNNIIIVHSYHHGNTRKVARAIAEIIGAIIKNPMDTNANELKHCGITGFGSGIDSGRHYKELLDFASELPQMNGRKCFIFSTSAIQSNKKTRKDHARLKEILLLKGYSIAGEFSCLGYNTNSFLKFFGGINKGRPNDEDIRNAEEFAMKLMLTPVINQ